MHNSLRAHGNISGMEILELWKMRQKSSLHLATRGV
jgi:hypothetical protein